MLRVNGRIAKASSRIICAQLLPQASSHHKSIPCCFLTKVTFDEGEAALGLVSAECEEAVSSSWRSAWSA